MRLKISILACLVVWSLITNTAAAELPVPCGACNGGVWVSSGSASLRSSTNALTVDQHTDRAILNWQSFNVGAGNSVNFRQPSANSIALNRIFQSDPSRILGSLNANGQVFLINQNGFLFGPSARVDTHSLVASSLGVTDEIFESLGITGAINADRAAFSGIGAGKIDIAEGAKIAAQKDGRILIIAPEINNSGELNSADGQVILAASHDKVYLEASADADLRGLLVEVETGGEVNNLGKIITERGNTTLLGAAVNQNGLIRATTSVTRNGSVRLLARDDASTIPVAGTSLRTAVASRPGNVSLGPGSRTEVLIDSKSGELATDAQAQAKSKVEIIAKQITLESEAEITVTGGNVDLLAAENLADPLADFFVANDASITLKQGAAIDVSGADDAFIPFERNLIEVDLRGNELRDNPVNRDGPVRGETVVVDARRGTNFADVTAFIDATERSVSERLASGGSVSLRSEGTIDLQVGSVIDNSGGKVSYGGGFNTASYLIREGALTPIAEADINVRYDGVFNFVENQYEKWSVTEIFNPFRSDPLWQIEAPYVEGANAGELTVVARDINFSGNTIATSAPGINQRFANGSDALAFEQMPKGGLLTIGDENTATDDFKLGTVVLGPTSNVDELMLDIASLVRGGVSRLKVFSNNAIVLPSGSEVALPAGGEISLRAGNVDIAGRLVANGGLVDITAGNTIATVPGEASVILGSGAAIDVSGRWVNDFLDIASNQALSPVFIDAGKVTLNADGPLLLNEGSVIKALGGGHINQSGALAAGSGGDVSLTVEFSTGLPPEMRLDGDIVGYSLEQAGSLQMTGPAFHFGSGGTSTGTNISNSFISDTGFSEYVFTANATGIRVASDAALALSRTQLVLGNDRDEGDVRVAEIDDTPTSDGNRLLGSADLSQIPTNADLLTYADIGQLPLIDRAPLSFSLNLERAASAGGEGEIIVDRGAAITADPGSKVSITSDRDLYFDGHLSAPASTVELQTKRRESAEEGFFADQSLWLGANAKIDVSGVFFNTGEDGGFRQGTVHDAGTIMLAANRGYLVGESNAVLTLDGDQGFIDLVDESSTLPMYFEQALTASAGTLILRSGDGIIFDSQVSQTPAPLAQSAGGSLQIDLDGELRATRLVVPGLGVDFPVNPREIHIGSSVPANFTRDSDFSPELNGQAFIGRQVLAKNTLDNLTFNAPAQGGGSGLIATGRIVFDSDTTLNVRRSLTLTAPEIDLAGSSVSLSAPVVTLGASTQNFRFNSHFSGGDGSLVVDADLLAVHGQLAINGAKFAQSGRAPVSLNASGDIVLVGTPLAADASDIAGSLRSLSDIHLDAARIFPTSFTHFDITVDRPGGKISTGGFGERTVPYSVAGQLTLSADTVEHAGFIAAPFGGLEITANEVALNSGSLVSVSGNGQEFLFGQTQFELDWLLQFPSINVELNHAPEKKVAINADKIAIRSGAKIDLSGGGDLRAFEFVPGPGGSLDILENAAAEGAFAIVPGIGSQPQDPVLGFSIGQFGETLLISDNDIVDAGEYAVLPAHYALLPNAYLIRPAEDKATTNTIAANVTRIGTDGLPIVAGKFSGFGSGIRDSAYSPFQVLTGQQVRARSEYVESMATEFFAGSAISPNDNGALSLAAGSALSIAGSVNTSGSGRASSIDIVANHIAIVEQLGDGPLGAVEIRTQDLSGLGNGSVLLGGSREIISNNDSRLNILSERVELIAGANLIRNEVILAASNDVLIGDGATLQARGQTLANSRLRVNGEGAVVAVTASDLSLNRSGSAGLSGSISVGDGALIAAQGSVILDASVDTDFEGRIQAAGGSVSLGGSNIAIGDTPAGLGGLVLSRDLLAGLNNAASLNLRSTSTIDFYGDLNLSFDQLRLESSGLLSQLNGDETFSIAAKEISLTGGATASGDLGSGPGSGLGQFHMQAEMLDFAGGKTGLAGFDSVVIDTGLTTWSADTEILVSSDLNLHAGQIIPSAATDLSLLISGDLDIQQGSVLKGTTISPELGGRLRMSADAVRLSADLALPSGELNIESTQGSIDLSGANLNLGGSPFIYDGTIVGTRGGKFEAKAKTDIVITDSVIDVSGVADSDSGEISLETEQNIHLASSDFIASRNGRLKVLANSLELATLIETADNRFSGEFDLRLRNSEINVSADTLITAQRISLVSDVADINIDGALVADASINGGHIRIFAGDDLNISNTASLFTKGANGNGGLIELGSHIGITSIDAAVIDTSGGDGDDGVVKIRAPVVGDDVNIAALEADFFGVRLLEAEAFSISNVGISDAVDSLDAFSGNLIPIAERLALDGLGFARVVPGVEVQIDGDFRTSNAINLVSKRYGGLPGNLTLRVSGDLAIEHSISDGVVNYEPFPGQLAPREAADVQDSWNLRIAAGADLLSADPLAGIRGTGNIEISDNVHIRTGTGSIQLSGGGDLSLLGSASNIYTVGVNRGTGSFGELLTEAYLEADFLERGGSIDLAFANNINVQARDQLVNDWLARFEGRDNFAGLGEFATGWGVNIGRFRQGLGTLGGGDIRVRAGGDITELGIVTPTTGLPTGPRGSDPEVAGGGFVDVRAGGDFIGGLVYTANGDAKLRVGGAIKAKSPSADAIILGIGDSRVSLEAGRDIDVLGVFDPFLLPQSRVQGASVFGSPVVPIKDETFFTSYASDSALSLSSVAGTIRFDTDVEALASVSSDITITGSDRVAASIAPPTFRAVAHSGSIEFGGSFTLFPSPDSQFELLAGNNIGLFQEAINSVLINFSDSDPASLPSVSTPSRTNSNLADRLGSFDNLTGTSHASVPLHINDEVPVKIVAREGQLGFSGSQTLGFSFAKTADIFAGGGIRNINLLVQHASPSDLSVVESGADIIYPFARNQTGFLNANVGLQLAVSGPGTLAVLAKNDIDLGTAGGIVSLGNTKNPKLPESGADLIVIPGFSRTNNAEFVEHLLSTDPSYEIRIGEFLTDNGVSTIGNPVGRFLTLDEEAQRPLLVDLFFEELIASGVDATTSGSDDYSRGFDAITSFFGTENASGDLSLLLSRISTIDGGNVNLLVPGGFINGGVATSTTIQKEPDQLGVVAQREGDVNIFVRDDLQVNQSRVFTLDGGRIAIWSSEGDIDAGRGAKSAVSIPGLITTIDTEGNVVTEFPPAVEGSGIRAAVASPGIPPGDVFLFAPRGAVIAGDAGIGSSGNLTIGATEVVGADNIDVGGVSVGVPSAEVGSVAAGFTGASDSSAAAGNSANATADETQADDQQNLADSLAAGAFSIISVEVLGFGG